MRFSLFVKEANLGENTQLDFADGVSGSEGCAYCISDYVTDLTSLSRVIVYGGYPGFGSY